MQQVVALHNSRAHGLHIVMLEKQRDNWNDGEHNAGKRADGGALQSGWLQPFMTDLSMHLWQAALVNKGRYHCQGAAHNKFKAE